MPEFPEVARGLVEAARALHARGWLLGTSGNLSAVVSAKPLRLAITGSGIDKGSLTPEQVLQVDAAGAVVEGSGRPSDETGLHLALVRSQGARAVVHTHSVWATLASDAGARAGGIALEGYEMLKGLRGVATHEHREWVPIVANSQDYAWLGKEIEKALGRQPAAHGILLHKHGLYTWGDTLAEAKRHTEILEFLLEVVARKAEDWVMAHLRIRDERRTVEGPEAVAAYLAGRGIDYERWESSHPVEEGAPVEAILEAYAGEIEKLKARGGYMTADVIDVTPETPGLEAMLAKFRREHWHDEDEVRFILRGSGIFFIRPREEPVFAIEVGPGDLIRVPRGTWHWFDLCADRRIRAIRLFQDPAGWTPHYTDSGVERGYEPVCLGPSQIRGESAASRP